MLKKELILEENKYVEQYHNAIFKLMDESNLSSYVYPIINLIHQTIENELKYFIAESYYNKQTYKDLKINNTHSLDILINREEFNKYYQGVEEFEELFYEYKKVVHYFGNVLGDNTFLSSRYSIETKVNAISSKINVNYDELCENWTKYSLLYSKMMLLYVSYSFSNSVLFFKKYINKTELDSFKLQIIKELKDVECNDEVEMVYSWINKFVERNKYFDMKYVNQ